MTSGPFGAGAPGTGAAALPPDADERHARRSMKAILTRWRSMPVRDHGRHRALRSRSRSIATLADYLVNGFWQYNSTIAHHWASNTITYNITGLNSAEQFLAQSALQAWHEVANITFVQTSGAANITFTHNGTMQAYTNAAWYGSGAIAYATVNISSDWITNDGGAYDGKTGIDSYGYQTYIHEIGHALGLGHQGPYNGSASYSTNAIYANDTWQYSIMSYFAENNYSGSSYRYVVTPQMADIYAIGSIYGAATSTRTGDTVYGFNSNAGAVFNFCTYSPAPALTIYDSGGNDTLDCSGYSSGADHRPASGRIFLGRRPRQQYRDRAQRDHREGHRRQRQRHADRERRGLHAVGRRRQRYADRRRRKRQADRRLRRRQSDRRRRRRHVRVPVGRQLCRKRPARPHHRFRFRRRPHRPQRDRCDQRHRRLRSVPLHRHRRLQRRRRRAQLFL